MGAQTCPGGGRSGLKGRYELADALRRLLAGSGCGFRLAPGGTVRILPPPAAAAPEAARPAPALAELLVTATKRQLPAERIGAAISVIGRKQLATTRAAEVRETAGQVSGVMLTNLGPGRDKLLIRGLSDGVFTGRARSTVGTYLDDTAINYDAPDPDLRLTDVERIEVVRGPQGALYGGGALAGVYRIVTRKPDLDHAAASLSASLAQTRGGSPSHVVEGFANLPLAPGRVGARLAAYHENQGGYLDDMALRRANVDRTRRDGVRAALRARPSADWVIDLSGAWQHLQSSDTQYITYPLPRGRANKVAEDHDNRFAEVALSVRGRLGPVDLSSSTAYVRHSYAIVYDASSALDLYDAADSQLGLYSESRRVRMLSEDLVVSSHGARRLGWLAGLYAVANSEDSPSRLQALPKRGPLATLYAETRADKLRGLAAYGEVSYEIRPGWTVAMGGRAVQMRVETDSDVFAPAPGRSRVQQRTYRFEDFAPKLSIQHDLADGGLAYLLFSTGYRPGGVNTAGLVAPSPARARFAPDHLRNYEFGLKLHPAGRISLQGAVFYDRWRNIQTDRYLASGLAYTANVGDAEILGLESEAALGLGDSLTLHANLLLSRARFVHRNPDFAPLLSRGLPGAPAATGGILTVYQRPLTRGAELQLVAAANYIGRSRLTFDAANARSMGGYLDMRLSAGLVTRRWRGEIFVTNPGNTADDTFAYGNPFSFGQVRQATPQRPRTVGVAATADF